MNFKRYSALDTLRGFAVVNMILYHALWDLVYIFGISIGWYKGLGGQIWQQAICRSFILLSGFCFPLSKRPIKNALLLLVLGFIISAVTIIFMPENLILFGILTFLGSAVLIALILDKLLKKVPPFFGFLTALGIFLIFKNIPYSAFEPLCINNITAFLGFAPDSFSSTDYFPIFPWIFLYTSGYFLHYTFKKYNLMHILTHLRSAPLEFIGKHSLLIYVLHQPIIYLVLIIIFKLF